MTSQNPHGGMWVAWHAGQLIKPPKAAHWQPTVLSFFFTSIKLLVYLMLRFFLGYLHLIFFSSGAYDSGEHPGLGC